MPWVSIPFSGLAPGEKGVPFWCPEGKEPVALP